jgi:hypothetical protein
MRGVGDCECVHDAEESDGETQPSNGVVRVASGHYRSDRRVGGKDSTKRERERDRLDFDREHHG